MSAALFMTSKVECIPTVSFMDSIIVKCRQCREELLTSEMTPVLTGHNILLTADSIHYPRPNTDCRAVVDSLYFEEIGLPEWLLSSINEAGWERGKVKCPKCLARLGSFNFVTGRKCDCNRFILPPVHIIKGKIDYQVVQKTQ